MAVIDVTQKLTAVGVGVVDEVFEALDERAGRVESFKKWTDYYRLGGTVLGLLLEIWGPGATAKIAKDAGGPLLAFLTKSIAKPMRKAVFKESIALSRRTASSPPAPRPPAGYGQTPKPGFEELRTY